MASFMSSSVPSSGDTVSCSSSHFEEYPQSVSSLGGSSASLNSDSVRSSSQNNVAGLEGKVCVSAYVHVMVCVCVCMCARAHACMHVYMHVRVKNCGLGGVGEGECPWFIC